MRGNAVELQPTSLLCLDSILYDSLALARIDGGRAGSTLGAGPDFFRQFLDLIGLAQHGNRENMD